MLWPCDRSSYCMDIAPIADVGCCMTSCWCCEWTIFGRGALGVKLISLPLTVGALEVFVAAAFLRSRGNGILQEVVETEKKLEAEWRPRRRCAEDSRRLRDCLQEAIYLRSTCQVLLSRALGERTEERGVVDCSTGKGAVVEWRVRWTTLSSEIAKLTLSSGPLMLV